MLPQVDPSRPFALSPAPGLQTLAPPAAQSSQSPAPISPSTVPADIELQQQMETLRQTVQLFRNNLQLDQIEEARPVLESEVKIVQEGLAKFAFDLSRHLSTTGKSYSFSPISLAIVMGMVLKAMPYGQAKIDMKHALHLHKLSEPRIHAVLGALVHMLASEQLKLANGMAVSKDVNAPINPEYLQTIEKIYAAKIFTTNEAQFIPAVNAWVAQQTKGMIPQLISDPNMFAGQQVHVGLLNAMYFSGDWRHPFPEKQTKPGPFIPETGPMERVMMMNQKRDFYFCQGDFFKMLRLPYASAAGDLSYVIFMPAGNTTIAELEAKLTPEVIRASLSSAHETEVNVTMPKVELGWKMEMKDVFRRMGMPVDEKMFNLAFDRHKLLAVLHETKMSVDEKGTRMAAATLAVGGFECYRRPEEFYVSKPHMVLLMQGENILCQACIKDTSVLIKAPQANRDASRVNTMPLNKESTLKAIEDDPVLKEMAAIPSNYARSFGSSAPALMLTHFEVAGKGPEDQSVIYNILNATPHLVELDNEGTLTLDGRDVKEVFSSTGTFKLREYSSTILIAELMGNLCLLQNSPDGSRKKEFSIEFA